jgi:hypothetical protein
MSGEEYEMVLSQIQRAILDVDDERVQWGLASAAGRLSLSVIENDSMLTGRNQKGMQNVS